MDRSTDMRESQPWTDLPDERASHGQIYLMREPAMGQIYLMRESQPWTDLPYER